MAGIFVARSSAGDSISLILNCLLAHISAKALSQSAVATLIALVLVNDAVAIETARVQVILAYTATEETLEKKDKTVVRHLKLNRTNMSQLYLASIATKGAIVLSSGAISANGADL